MLMVKGIYDGTKVVLSEPLPLPPNSPVEVLILDGSTEKETAYWRKLLDLGLIKSIKPRPEKAQAFTPVSASGEPVSQTIINERR
jgi:hypothetical protein